MRLLYTILLYLLTPLVLLRLLWKSRLQPEYRQRIGERFGYVPPVPGGVAVWVHAVSVGESLAALPLIEALIRRHGEGRIWVTTTTPTGSARVAAALGARVRHSYAPYDLPGAVARFLDRARPRQVVVMETELWPTLFRAVRRRGLPLLVANARLSPRSFKGYSRFRRSIAGVLADCSQVAAQSEADAERFRQLGAPRVSVMGNIKFDLAVPEAQVQAGRALREALGAARPVWIAASTHEGEEQAALEAHALILKALPQALLLLVPRHPQRFDEVAKQIARSGQRSARRSAGAGRGGRRGSAAPPRPALPPRPAAAAGAGLRWNGRRRHRRHGRRCRRCVRSPRRVAGGARWGRRAVGSTGRLRRRGRNAASARWPTARRHGPSARSTAGAADRRRRRAAPGRKGCRAGRPGRRGGRRWSGAPAAAAAARSRSRPRC